MLYRFLGILVWRGAKALLRYRYGTLRAPKPLIAAVGLTLLAGVGAVVLALFKRDGSADSDD